MITKGFNLGAACKGETITVSIDGKFITIICKEGESFRRCSVSADFQDAEQQLDNFLSELTMSYYIDQIMDWIKTKVYFKQTRFW